MTGLRLVTLSLALVVCASSTLVAQVGYDPEHSPYRDLPESMELTLFSGFYKAKTDPARVAPRSGPMVGVLYQWRAGGPANLNLSFARVASERRVLDPERPDSSQLAVCGPTFPGECKAIGMFRWPVYFLDAGLALSLTGARSFHNFVPEIKTSLGLATDFHTQPDVGDFAFGTRFAFTWGAGIRWVSNGRYQLRADVLNHLYSVRYPAAYYQSAPDKSVIFSTQSQTAWLNNPGISIGVSYLFSR